MSTSPFGGRVFKQRNRVAGNTGNSTFDETSDEQIKIPDIEGVIEHIDEQLDKSKEIVIHREVIQPIKVRRSPCCWSTNEL